MAGNDLKEFVLTDKDGIPKKGSDIDYNGQPAGCQDPTEIQNYVDKHDNQTPVRQPGVQGTAADLVRMQGVSWRPPCRVRAFPSPTPGAIELLRSKSMERDSYDSGDWYK